MSGSSKCSGASVHPPKVKRALFMWKCPCSDALTLKGGREGGESPEAEGGREHLQNGSGRRSRSAAGQSGGNANELFVPLPPSLLQDPFLCPPLKRPSTCPFQVGLKGLSYVTRGHGICEHEASDIGTERGESVGVEIAKILRTSHTHALP